MVTVYNKVVNYECINGEMEKKASFKRKQKIMQSQPIRYEEKYSGEGGFFLRHYYFA